MKLAWEWWLQVWPNLAASVICLPVAFTWHRLKLRRELDRRDALHAEHHAKTHALVRELRERLSAQIPPGDET